MVLALQGAVQQSLTLGIDDLQWVDEESYVALSYALRRLQGADVRVLATRLPLSARTIPDATVMQLSALSAAEIRTAVEERTGQRLATDTSIALQQAVGGNPMHALAVAEDLPDDATPADVRLPRSLIELVRDRLEALPADTRDALLDVAVLGVLPLGQRPVPVPLHPAVMAEVVDVRRGEVRFTHPLLLRAVLDTAPPTALDAARRRATDAEADPVRRGLLLAGVGDRPDEDLASLLEQAASIAARRADLTAAPTLAMRAVQLTPDSADPSVRWRRTYWSAQVMASMGDLPGWLEERLMASARSPDDAVLGLIVLSQAQENKDNDLALRTAERALRVPGASATAHGRAAHHVTGLRFFRGEAVLELADQLEPTVATLLESRRQCLSSSGALPPAASTDLADLADLVSLYVYWRRLAGVKADPRLLELAAALDPRPSLTGQSNRWVEQAQMATWDDRHEEARALLDRGTAPWLGLQAPDDTYVYEPACLFYLVELEVRLGNLSAAEQHIARLPPDSQHPWRFLTAMIAAWRGDVERCRREAGDGLIRAAAVGDRMWPLAMHSALALGLLAADEPELAWQVAEPVCQEMHRRGWVEPSVFPVLPVAVEAGTRTGRTEVARALHERLRQAADALDSRWARAAADRCAAHLAMAGTDSLDDAFELAVRSTQEFDALGLRLEAGRSALTAGRAARRAGRRRDARAWLDASIGRFAPDVTAGFAMQAAAEKARLGGRRPAGNTLTPAERRIAELAAGGASNPAIAEAEFLSVKTVETHLSRIYRKLGVRSRAELASRYSPARLGDETARVVSTDQGAP